MIFREEVKREGLNKSLIMFLELAERLAHVEFEITSAFREGDDGSHGEGWAVDIACVTSVERMAIFKALTGAGFRRIGLYNRHIHVDRSLDRPQNVLWTGVSK